MTSYAILIIYFVWQWCICVYICALSSHGENRSDHIQWCNEDAELCYESRQQQGPRGLSISFTVSKNLCVCKHMDTQWQKAAVSC